MLSGLLRGIANTLPSAHFSSEAARVSSAVEASCADSGRLSVCVRVFSYFKARLFF